MKIKTCMLFAFVFGQSFYSCEDSKSYETGIVDLTPIGDDESKSVGRDSDDESESSYKELKRLVHPLDFKTPEEYEKAIESLVAADRDGKYRSKLIGFTVRSFIDASTGQALRDSVTGLLRPDEKKFESPYSLSVCDNMKFFRGLQRRDGDEDCNDEECAVAHCCRYHEYELHCCNHHCSKDDKSCFERYAYTSFLLQPRNLVVNPGRASIHERIQTAGFYRTIQKMGPKSETSVIKKLQARSLGLK